MKNKYVYIGTIIGWVLVVVLEDTMKAAGWIAFYLMVPQFSTFYKLTTVFFDYQSELQKMVFAFFKKGDSTSP